MLKGHRFEHNASWMSWLYRVATNVCLKKLRSEATRKRLLARENFATSYTESPEGEVSARQEVFALLDRVDNKSQGIAFYYYLDELPQERIAEIMGISLGEASTSA